MERPVNNTDRLRQMTLLAAVSLLVATAGFLGLRQSSATTVIIPVEAESGVIAGNAAAVASNGASGNQAVVFRRSTVGPSPLITNRPAQPAAVIYSDSPDLTATRAYARPGALVIAGRNAYQNQAFKDVAAGGGTVLIYIDVMIDNTVGRYHQLLLNSSECGGVVPAWPGSPSANTYGVLADFRVGGVLQGKLECVLEKMVAENPHMGGFFADDLGSRSYYPNFSWDSWSTTDKQAYRDGAIAAAQTFRKVANRYGLFVMVNGTWNAGSVTASGGGYPDASAHGLSLADGGFFEHPDDFDIAFSRNYLCSAQWANQSPLTRGKSFNWAVTYTAAARTKLVHTGCLGYGSVQDGYEDAPVPWTDFHPTGLPNKVGGPISM